MTQTQNLITVKKFNKGVARMVTSTDWCGLSKNIKLICNTFICDLVIEFYKATKKKFNLVAIPLVGLL
jgi:uncharacterized ion transporter superfamily protein YfcC